MVAKIEDFELDEIAEVVDLEKEYTLAEYELVANLNYGYELDEGRLIVLSPTKPPHGTAVTNLITYINAYVKQHKLGKVYSGEVGFNLFPTAKKPIVRAPDVAFLSKIRIARGDVKNDEWIKGPPDLAIEVLSPSDRPRRKIKQYMDAGTSLLWVVNTSKRMVTVYRPGAEPEQLKGSDVLSGGSMLPGFSLTVSEIFEE